MGIKVWQRISELFLRYQKNQPASDVEKNEEEEAFFHQWDYLQDQLMLAENHFRCHNDVPETDGAIYAHLSAQKRFDALIRQAKEQGLTRNFQANPRPWRQRIFDHTMLYKYETILPEEIPKEENKEKKKKTDKGRK